MPISDSGDAKDSEKHWFVKMWGGCTWVISSPWSNPGVKKIPVPPKKCPPDTTARAELSMDKTAWVSSSPRTVFPWALLSYLSEIVRLQKTIFWKIMSYPGSSVPLLHYKYRYFDIRHLIEKVKPSFWGSVNKSLKKLQRQRLSVDLAYLVLRKSPEKVWDFLNTCNNKMNLEEFWGCGVDTESGV